MVNTSKLRARKLLSRALLVALAPLAFGAHGCLIDPKKDYPVQTTANSGAAGEPSEPIGGAPPDGGAPSGSPTGGSTLPDPGGAGGESPAPPTGCAGNDDCPLGQECQAQTCTCTTCQATDVPSPPGSCTLTNRAQALGFFDAPMFPAQQAIDGDASTVWSPNDYTGKLQISLTPAAPVASIILVPDASPGSSVDYTITVNGAAVVPTLSAHFNASGSSPWVEVDLPTPTLVNEIAIDGESKTTWISIREVLVTSCNK